MNASICFLPRLALAIFIFACVTARGANPAQSGPGDAALAEYFRAETAKLEARCLADIHTLDDWNEHREEYRQQLFEMLSLSPLPERTELKAVVTGKVERDSFVVEKLHFQSLPGLYVTANVYLPKSIPKPAPAILYVSGHGPVISNGVSYGNKVSYQHHGAWFARNGYVCMVLDTLQLGEIEGLHHGTYREGMWWWNSRGYTPAGVEAWNSIRALDYLQTRPEVDASRFGVTGRSGGGAYSWWLAALDDRIKAAAPVAGITDLRNHVVDGTVEGHCDCMFTVNTYRWDYPQVAALVAPRALMIANTDNDSIFPLDGVVRLHAKVRKIFELHKAPDKLGLLISEGPHKDTQDLQVPVFRWFNRHLKGEDPLIEMAAVKFFAPHELKVFDTLPADQINTNIQAVFVAPAAPPVAPPSKEAWQQSRDGWMAALRQKTFAGWPDEAGPLELEPKFSVVRNGVRLAAYDFTSQANVRLRLYVASAAALRKPERVVLNVVRPGTRSSEHGLAYATWDGWLAAMRQGFAKELGEELATLRAPTNAAGNSSEKPFAALTEWLQTSKAVLACVAPRGVGLTSWNPNERKQVQIRRRFMLLGQTLDGMRAWDIRRAVQAARATREGRGTPLWLQAEGDLAGDALFASLFEPGLARLDLWSLPKSQRDGGDILNVLRVLDVPQAVAMAAERSQVRLHQTDARGWDFPMSVAGNLGWPAQSLIVTSLPQP